MLSLTHLALQQTCVGAWSLLALFYLQYTTNTPQKRVPKGLQSSSPRGHTSCYLRQHTQALQKLQAAAPRDMLKPGGPGTAGQGAMSDTQPQQSASQPCHLHSLPLQSPNQSLSASKGYDQDFFGLHLQNVVRNKFQLSSIE